MNKKVIGIIVVIVIICGGCLGALFLSNRDVKETGNTNNNANKNDVNNNDSQDNGVKDNESKLGKVLVVYFSATSNTKKVALKIAENLESDVFEIEPVKEYTTEDLSWTNSNSRVSREHDDVALRNVKLKVTNVANWDSYDTIIIGYPIWWGIAAWPVNTFVKDNDFKGKTVIPFCTSASSGLGESDKLLEKEANGGNWLNGYRFTSSPSDGNIKSFIDSIK